MKVLELTKQITNIDSISLDKYLDEIGKYQLSNQEEEVELARKARNGDKSALNKLVLSNLRFVISVSKQYQNQGLSLDDLINEGNIGLVKAAERFDETKGFKFISYSVWWIRQSIMHALTNDSRLVRLPSLRLKNLRRVKNTSEFLEKKLERPPSLDELEDEIKDIPQGDIKQFSSYADHHVSIDAPVNGDNDLCMKDLMQKEDEDTPELEYIKSTLKAELERILSSVLPPRSVEILKLYFGLDEREPMSYEEIGRIFDLKYERIRQIKEDSLQKLKNNYRSKKLKELLEYC